VFIGDYQAGGLSLFLSLERTRGGGVLIKEDKRMFWVMIRKSIKETKAIRFSFFYSIKFQFQLFV
jgi:hypothetical protein